MYCFGIRVEQRINVPGPNGSKNECIIKGKLVLFAAFTSDGLWNNINSKNKPAHRII